MRNLTLSATHASQYLNGNITAIFTDTEGGFFWFSSERLNVDADLHVEIWKEKIEKVEDVISNSVTPSVVATLTSTSNRSVPDDVSQIASLAVVMDDNSLVVITRGGDIATMRLDDPEPTFDTVGSVEGGILAAAWSPDSTLLALVSGNEKLILMTSTFDVLSETFLHTEDSGEDTPMNVGWGSKQTQFHGTLGKAAAHAPSPSILTSVGSSPDDDTLPRICWRGDGAFFVVSSLSLLPPASSQDTLRRRILRVYNREAVLQSTSEPVAGLEHVLSWRPSGNLIIGTQRFGTSEGIASGKEGRHDVIFFERNGLRHGEFSLREQASEATGAEQKQRRWGYKVRELSWSADSSVLAVWIEEDEGDVDLDPVSSVSLKVQLWTTGNYHWYLKQEIAAPSNDISQPGRFTYVSWHPENALELLLTTRTAIIHRTYKWDTCVSHTMAPDDTGSVAVADGATILLTPFRIQNVPPPMSSYQLSLTPSVPPSRRQPTPIHVSFSPSRDTIAVLWEKWLY